MTKESRESRKIRLRLAGVRGGFATYRKYGRVGGDPQKRITAWRKWWENGGKEVYSNFYNPKPISYPRKSVELAELSGILLGDGGIAKYQIIVTLNSVTDNDYVLYVVKLFKKLFRVTPSINKMRSSLAVNVVVSRISLVKFCVENLDLKQGHKVRQQVDMPNWIKASKKFRIACVRGLVDTDGSIFTHRYKSNGKYYSYKKLDYTSLSRPLLQSVYEIMKDHGLHPRLYRGKSIRLDSIQDMESYFAIFSTSNSKHLRRYKE